MSYTVIDLLDKIINIAESKKNNYSSYLKDKKENSKDYFLVKVINKNIDKSIDYYKKLRNEVYAIDTEEIDFSTYDKISFLINEFKNSNICEDLKDKNSTKLENSYLNFQKEVLALNLSIAGRLVKNEKDTKTKAYETFQNLIEQKRKNIIEIEKFIKDYSK